MTDDKPPRHLMAVTILICIVTLAMIALYRCGQKTVVQHVPPAAPATCDGQALGAARTQPCPAGQTGAATESCQADSTGAARWVQVATTCAAPPNPTPPGPTPPSPPGPTPPSPPAPPGPPAPPSPPSPPQCGFVTFDDVKPIMQANCAACHAPTFQAATLLGPTEMARRVALPTSDNNHMPQPIGNNPPVSLSPADVKTIQDWVAAGAPQDCTSRGPTSGFIDLNYQDSAALADAEALPTANQATTIYLYAGHAINQGAPLQTWVQAINKALNGTNNDNDIVAQVVPVDPKGAVLRVDLAAFGLQAGDLAKILAADVNIHVVDQTTKGKALAAILGHTPWLHLDNWVDITYRNSAVYYQLIGNPANVNVFEKNVGVNVGQDLANLQNINLIGSTSSPIAEQKNRLLLRDNGSQRSRGCYWRTFDVNAVPHNVQVIVNGQRVVEDTKNLVQFPLPLGAGALALPKQAQNVFTQDASESIGCLANGFLAYFLADGQGNRLNFADPNVVRDTASPVGNGTINDANSCVRCHNAGFIPMADQILAIDGHTTQLPANDVQIVQTLYGSSAAAGAMFKKDSSVFLQALALAGVTAGPDPMSAVTDNFLQNYDLNKAAALLFLTPAAFVGCVNQSAASTGQIGNILSPGGQVTFVQLVAALPQLIADCHLFQDPVGG